MFYSLCRAYSLCECLINLVPELYFGLFSHAEARSRIRICNDNTLVCSNTVCFSCGVSFVHALIQCITGLFNRNHSLVSAQSFFFFVGIALHARSISKPQRNLTCGACLGFWSSTWRDLCTIDIVVIRLIEWFSTLSEALICQNI